KKWLPDNADRPDFYWQVLVVSGYEPKKSGDAPLGFDSSFDPDTRDSSRIFRFEWHKGETGGGGKKDGGQKDGGKPSPPPR
ncbi:hypothetical protein D6833_09405, partial [Candidatus Parcubacteria bacterium]